MNFLSGKTENVKMEFQEELMDVIEAEVEGCYEDGEINSDEEKDANVRIPIGRSSIFSRCEPTNSGSSTELVFDEDETLKKLDRARRFSIPDINSEITEVHEEQLLSLYRDLGIDKENERHYRFNSIHMRGTENMSTEDVLEYFALFSPSYVEWINDVSCNVVWIDDITTARAFLNLSRRIKNLDKVHLNADPFEKEFRSDSPDEVSDDDGSIDARNIRTAIPPGYWRLGVPCEKSKYLLLRYATKTDKKQRNAEKNSEYYRKYGNPNYGNVPGLISNSLRAQMRKQRFRQLDGDWESEQENDRKNPWEDLAYEWGEKDKEDNHRRIFRHRKVERDILKSDIPDLRISLLSRKFWAKRFRADFEANSNSSDIESWESRSKVPRMKMYADDENLDKNISLVSPSSPSGFNEKPVEDLRDKINLKKIAHKGKFKRRKKMGDSSELSASENEYDDGDSGDWALEHYHDLRESLEQNKSKHQRHKFLKDESESDDDLSDSFEERDLNNRSPLQIEIENDECYLNKK